MAGHAPFTGHAAERALEVRSTSTLEEKNRIYPYCRKSSSDGALGTL